MQHHQCALLAMHVSVMIALYVNICVYLNLWYQKNILDKLALVSLTSDKPMGSLLHNRRGLHVSAHLLRLLECLSELSECTL